MVVGAALGIAITSDVRADPDTVRVRPPVDLILAACLDDVSDAFEQAARVELGDRTLGADQVAVRVDCAKDGIDTGVVIEVRPTGSARRYRYALDWRAQPVDLRPRLVGLAIAEAVDASQIELTAVAEPAPAVERVAVAVPAPIERLSGWKIGLVGSWRSFGDRAGVTMSGGGLVVSRAMLPRLRVAIDAIAETQTLLVESGAIDVLSVSSSPRAIYRIGGDFYAELGIGARIGVVRMHGETLTSASETLAGHGIVRTWIGPVATIGAGMALGPRLAIEAGVEVGVAAVGSTANELGEPAAVVDGRWLAIGVTTNIAL